MGMAIIIIMGMLIRANSMLVQYRFESSQTL